MLNDVQRANLNRRFDRLDADGDGYITDADYANAARKMAAALGRDPGLPEVARAERELHQAWLEIANASGGGPNISRAQFMNAVDTHPETAARQVRATTQAIFDLCDLDGDGKLDHAEFTAMMQALNVPAEAADDAFHRLDQDQDGLVSRTEFSDAAVDTYLGTDPNGPGNWLFGTPHNSREGE